MEFEERGINFRQAQRTEKRCPYVKMIEIAEALIGEKAEELVEKDKNNRDAFCHLRMDVQKYSDGDPQLVEKANLVPEKACDLTCRLLLKQLNLVGNNIPSEEVPSTSKEEIINRWKKFILENKPDVPSHTLTKKEVINRVSVFAQKLQLMMCHQAPTLSIIDHTNDD
jgi:hypothetical protein